MDQSTQTETATQYIKAEQVRLLYSQTTIGYFATAINATLLLLVLIEVVPGPMLYPWYAILLLIIAGRVTLVSLYKRSTRAYREPERWSDWYMTGALLTGMCWGYTGVLLFFIHDMVYQLFIIVVTAGMTAGAVVFLSAQLRVCIAYIVPALLPLIIWLLTEKTDIHVYTGVMVSLFLLVLIRTSQRINTTLTNSLQLRVDNLGLIDNLKSSQSRLMETNRELKEKIEQASKAEKELYENNQFLERVLESSTNGIYVLDLEGRFIRVNQASSQISGYTRTELLGMHFSELMPAEQIPAMEKLFHRVAVQGEQLSHVQIEIVRKSGERRIVMFSTAPLLEETGITAVVGAAEDITELTIADRLKNEFVSTISHELRTPLTSIRGSLGLMKGGVTGELQEQAKNLVNIAYQNCDRLLVLINDLLDIQKLEAGEMEFEYETCNLTELVDHTIDINRGFAEEYHVNMVADFSKRRINVYVDKYRFIQALTNLLSNAIKFSDPGGAVEINIALKTDRASVLVTDHGAGIAPKFHHRIFNKFVQADASDTRHRGGTGLGLVIVKHIMERMQGKVDFESVEGDGSTFVLTLPRMDAPGR